MAVMEHLPASISYELQHTAAGAILPGCRWFFGRDLGSDGIGAQMELLRVRALAAGGETGVLYRIVMRTERVMGW